ncbi:hypothetical protein STCU_00445 [Strigomonas culicis]|uniref:Uncharacterized protein n=1 Tax=Strigomonas culicis TaxID=28005 RepID=S9WC73_9TRYP|nr:hypothetical protein STCU_00445 [Strigomonas culicis]|eukprot:EPY36711.1 hypothetical protein STCU_00445 [Strigomonas culicis]
MLRRTVLRRVEFFSTLVPNAVVTAPAFLTEPELSAAKAAIQERQAIFRGIDLAAPFEVLTNVDSMPKRNKAQKDFEHLVDELRGVMYKPSCVDPSHRLQLHEAIMAAGFYARSINTNELHGESIRFVVNHFNFDVRRDTLITKKVHESLLEEVTTTKESEELLSQLLQLERHLSGHYRFHPTGGRRWFTLGLALSELGTEAEVDRVLNLPIVKEHGNFAKSEVTDKDPLWKTVVVTPQKESFTTFLESAGLDKGVRADDLAYNLRVEKPAKPLEYWERVREMLLRYWVIWFSLWAMFFMVDEEIITLVALIVLKHRQTKILEEEAERTGGKVYIACASGPGQRGI